MVSLGKSDLCSAAPIIEKSFKFFSLHSIFAPRSKTTLIPFLFGHKPDKAGLSMLFIISRFNLAITNKAPVLPADKTMSEVLFLTLSIASHILVSLPLFAAVKALSSPIIFLSVWIISNLFVLIFLCFKILLIDSLLPKIL